MPHYPKGSILHALRYAVSYSDIEKIMLIVPDYGIGRKYLSETEIKYSFLLERALCKL